MNLGVFKRNPERSWFEGQTDWLGKLCNVYLDTDGEGAQTADKAFQHLKALYDDLPEWDRKFREYAAGELTDFINDMFYEEAPLTEQQFAEKLSVAEVRVAPTGEIAAYYTAEAFTGQAVQILTDNHQDPILAELDG